jgi:hypothetical protein
MVDLVTGPDRGHRISCQNMECSRENKNKRLLASHSRAIFYWTIAVQGIGQEAQHRSGRRGTTGPGLFAVVRKPNQQGRIDHAQPFAYLSFRCLKSWRLCAVALTLSLEAACLDAQRRGQDIRLKGRS